jgi:hypothetical protein
MSDRHREAKVGTPGRRVLRFALCGHGIAGPPISNARQSWTETAEQDEEMLAEDFGS